MRLNTARYSLAAADGDDDEAVRAVREVLWLVRLANSLGGNINRLNGIVIELHASEASVCRWSADRWMPKSFRCC